MTELAIRPNDNGWGVLDVQPERTTQAVSLAEWVTQAQQVAQVADMLCRTSFVPKAFVGKPAECAAAILAGQEMGMSPMASLRAIDVIEGKPGMGALGLRALVQSKGHEIWVHESTATRAIVRGRRRGSDKVETSTWTIDRARTFGLLGKKNWREQPTAMLLARATAECARLVAADALLGMPYSTEELADLDVDEQPGTAAPEPAPKRRTARRAAAKPAAPVEPEPEPEFDEPAPGTSQPAVQPAPPAEAMVSRPQMRKMHALFNERGITDRDERLAYVAQAIGRDVGSSNELTLVEAGRVIDALEGRSEPADADEPGFDDWPPTPAPGDAS